MTDVTGLDLLFLGELDGGVQCFGEFGASGRARTVKISSRVRELYKLTWYSRFPRSKHLGGWRERKKLEKLRYF